MLAFNEGCAAHIEKAVEITHEKFGADGVECLMRRLRYLRDYGNQVTSANPGRNRAAVATVTGPMFGSDAGRAFNVVVIELDPLTLAEKDVLLNGGLVYHDHAPADMCWGVHT